MSTSKRPATWKEWQELHKITIKHSKYEWTFVDRVLKEVIGLEPSQVHPQYPFTGADGRQYHMDFAIITNEKQIAIELEGFDKSGNNQGPSKEDHKKFNRRIQDLSANGWTTLTIANSQFSGDPGHYVLLIRQMLISTNSNQQSRRPLTKNPRNLLIGIATLLIIGALIGYLVFGQTKNLETVRRFTGNCSEVRQTYPDGIVKNSDVLKDPNVVKAGEKPYVNNDLYWANRDLDGDDDGRICD